MRNGLTTDRALATVYHVDYIRPDWWACNGQHRVEFVDDGAQLLQPELGAPTTAVPSRTRANALTAEDAWATSCL